MQQGLYFGKEFIYSHFEHPIRKVIGILYQSTQMKVRCLDFEHSGRLMLSKYYFCIIFQSFTYVLHDLPFQSMIKFAYK